MSIKLNSKSWIVDLYDDQCSAKCRSKNRIYRMTHSGFKVWDGVKWMNIKHECMCIALLLVDKKIYE